MTFKKIIPFLLLIYSCNKLFAREITRIESMINNPKEYQTRESFSPRPREISRTIQPATLKPNPPPTILQRSSSNPTFTYRPADKIERTSIIPTLFQSIPRTDSSTTLNLLRQNQAVLNLDPSTLPVESRILKPLPPQRANISRSYSATLPTQTVMISSQPAEKLGEPSKSGAPTRTPSSTASKKMVDAGTASPHFETPTELSATGNKISFNTGSPLASSHKKAQFIKLPKKGFGLSFNEDIDRQFSGLQDHVRDRLVPGLKYGKDYNIVLAENDEIAVLKLHIKGASKNGEKQKGVSLIMINANGQIYYYSAKTKKWISAESSQGERIVQALKKIVSQRMPSKSRHRSNYSSVHKSRKSNPSMMSGKKLSKTRKSAYSENVDNDSDNDSDTETTDLDDTSSRKTGSARSSSHDSSLSSDLDIE